MAGSGFQDGEVLSAGQDIMLLELVGVELGLSRASRPLCGGDLGCCRPDSALADGLCFNPALSLPWLRRGKAWRAPLVTPVGPQLSLSLIAWLLPGLPEAS